MREHERDDALPTSVRFLFYELVARAIISKEKTSKRRPDQIVIDASKQLREKGIIPWGDIVDETRVLDNYSGASSIKNALIDYLPHARLDAWGGETVLVLTESRSLAGVLRSIAFQYRVRIASTNGQCGGFLHTQIAPLLQSAVASRVLYLGDFDLCGNQIESNTRSVLEQKVGALDWERVALTEDQVVRYDLPRIIKTDRRYTRKSGRHEAVETEALSQRLIVELLEAKLRALLTEPLAVIEKREERQRRALRKKI